MGKGTLTIYSASAGSGKTYTLTEIYLSSLFSSRYNYRKILAVTFTNKATAEMKSRILENLHKLSSGEQSDYLGHLLKVTGKSEERIRHEAGEILNTILHDFSRFSISTIDSFFQKILRAFTREVGLQTGFNVELDHSTILSEAVDEMLASAVEGTELNRWLTSYAMNNISEEKSWNLKDGIMKLSEELFREEFRILEDESGTQLSDKQLLTGYIEKVRSVRDSFEKKLNELGTKAGKIFSDHGLRDDMFYHKGTGIPGYIRSLQSEPEKVPNSYVREIQGIPPKWSTGKQAPELAAALAAGLEAVLLGALDFYDTNITSYLTAKAVLSNIYALGILLDVRRKVLEITNDENSFILSYAGDVLRLITNNDQAPFIYEKVGNRYENFMIDEFQDTSAIQWKNLKPLVDNSMAEGFDNLVVGDVKQSIYRWRNSDWKILGVELDRLIDNDRVIKKSLTGNWRSLPGIIRFNNSLFTSIPAMLDEQFTGSADGISFRKIYTEAVQTEPPGKNGGYVSIGFIEGTVEKSWQALVAERLPEVVESLQDNGYDASDIGIIVRDGREGASVLKTFIDYSNTCSEEKKARYNYSAVSGDSLLLANSHAISFIISVLSHLNDPGDMISRALMLRYFLLAHEIDEASEVLLATATLDEGFSRYFPEGYGGFLEKVSHLPLFEATERIIGFFGLGERSSNVAYLNTFQDYVTGFTGNRSGGIQAFLEWWEETGSGKSVALPGNQSAMRILTIHKSKGLEFKVVLLPFISWNMDHMGSKQPVLWVRPQEAPFSDLGFVPVRYSTELGKTFFADSYAAEKHAIYVDNLNLLYVALTRAREVIIGFAPGNQSPGTTIAGILRTALQGSAVSGADQGMNLTLYLDQEKNTFTYGELPVKREGKKAAADLIQEKYRVSETTGSLRLKLHGENYFSFTDSSARERINYGRLMHEVFEKIRTPDDISHSLEQMLQEGRISLSEREDLETRITELLTADTVKEWFMPGNKVMTEAGILLPSGSTRRPDRIIFRDGKISIIDFKFGEEARHYAEQVDQYRTLMLSMGYENIGCYLWYVDKNKIFAV